MVKATSSFISRKKHNKKGTCIDYSYPAIYNKIQTFFYLYYKFEQMGESIHVKMNMLLRRLAPVRPHFRRLWTIIEHYEMMDTVDQKHLDKRKKKR